MSISKIPTAKEIYGSYMEHANGDALKAAASLGGRVHIFQDSLDEYQEALNALLREALVQRNVKVGVR